MNRRDDLAKLIAEANARFDALTPEQKRAHREEQRRSYLRAEAAFGSDADEAAYHAALASGQNDVLVMLEAQAVERMNAVDKYLEDEKEGRG